jgi:hypothetical protein
MVNTDRLQAFDTACKKITSSDRQRIGIGTLSEKTVHAILKNFYAPDEDTHEVPIENFVADIYENGEIIEIQTRQFNKMRGKLTSFLPLYHVTICYPIAREKNLIWIDKETGELSERRKSPLKGSVYSVFPELYKIKAFLTHPNLRLKLVLMDMDEYKFSDGWGKNRHNNSTKYDRIPTALVDEVEINCIEDYMQFVPYDLPEQFTAKEFARSAHIKTDLASVVLNILFFTNTVKRVGKSGKSFLYEVYEYNN